MAYEETLVSITMDADSSIGTYTGVPSIPGAPANNSGLQYRFVKVTGAHTVGLVTVATDNALGVLQNKPQGTGHAATVAIYGVSNVEAGGVIAAGDSVASDTVGRAVTSASNVRGVALRAATATGQLIPVLIRTN